jgi:nicotinate dehydrogenase subunit A
MSIDVQCSISRPSRTRKMSMNSSSTRFPVGGRSQSSPRCVPRNVLRVATRSRSASCSLISTVASGKPRSSAPQNVWKPLAGRSVSGIARPSGCGLGLCGACLVLVDGLVAYSCDTPLWAVRDKEVTTVEGLGTPDQPHPVTRALIAGQAAQCGYCLSGVIMAAVGLLRRNADPSDEEVRAALDGNLCRCGAHNRIVRAVLEAAAELLRDPVETA